MHLKRALIVAAGVLLLPVCIQEVGAQVSTAETAMKIVRARKTNAALMQQFTWNSRTELVHDGKVRDIRIDLVQYDPDGQLQRTLLNDEGSRLPIRFLRRAIAKSKKKQTEQYLKGLRNLLDQYTLPTSDKVLAFMGSADVEFTQAPDGTTLLRMSGSDVVVPGDTLSIWVNASTHEMRKAQITTTYEGDEANATGTFKTLSASGLTFMSMAEVAVPAKNMTLQVHNFDYEQND